LSKKPISKTKKKQIANRIIDKQKVPSTIDLFEKQQESVKNILKTIKTVYGADNVTIYLYDEKTLFLRNAFHSGRKTGSHEETVQPGTGVIGETFVKNKESNQPASLTVPLSYKKETIGVIHILRSGKKTFTKKDLTLARSFNKHIETLCSLAEENEHLRQEHAQQTLPMKLSKELSGIRRVDELSRKLFDFIQENFKYMPFGFFLSIDNKLLQYKTGYEWGIKPDTQFKITKDCAIGWSVQMNDDLFINDIKKNKRTFRGNKSIRSLYVMPLPKGMDVIGIVAFGSKQKGKWNNSLATTLKGISVVITGILLSIVASNEAQYYAKKIENLNNFVNSVIKGFPSGIITVDKWGNITLMNKPAQKVFEYSEFDAKRITIKQLFEYRHATLNPLLTTLMENKPLMRIETTIISKDGNKVPIGFSTSLLQDESGNITGAIGIMKELTKIKEVEEGLRREDRLIALGEMAAGMAHEIRNPLAGIKTGVQYLGRFLDDDKKEAVTLIVNEITRLNRIVTDMSSYANRPPIKLDNVDIGELIDISLAFLKYDIEEKEIELIKGYDQKMSQVRLDSDQIREVFDNILLNALQASDQGGKIIITTNTVNKENRFEVRITDNGMGISEADRERIFNPFFTTKRGGTGLGLSICYRIISEHKGYIIISSKMEKGTMVKVVLPIDPEV